MGADVLSVEQIRDAVAVLRKSNVTPMVVTSKRMAAQMNRADKLAGLKGSWRKGDTFYWGYAYGHEAKQ